MITHCSALIRGYVIDENNNSMREHVTVMCFESRLKYPYLVSFRNNVTRLMNTFAYLKYSEKTTHCDLFDSTGDVIADAHFASFLYFQDKKN